MPGSGSKILLVANTGWYLYNFRLPLARYLSGLGLQVVLVSPRDRYVSRLEAEGFRWAELKIDRRSMNPCKELLALWEFVKLYRTERPTGCHHFTIKCVLYGTIAAKLAGIRSVVNAVTGLGHMFLGEGPVTRLMRPLVGWLYRRILTARRVQVVFQNIDDVDEFRRRNLILPEKTTLIRGSGVNLTRFRPRPGGLDEQPAPTVLFASRLIREKGLVEFVEAARLLKSRGLAANFAVAGAPDPGNPSSIEPALLQSWIEEGVIDYLGHVENVEPLLELAALVVLPSYREGTPRILLEAAAMGKPMVATDVPGCREVVRPDVNGVLVPPRDAAALAEGISGLLQDSPRRESFGRQSREVALEFCESQVFRATAGVYQRCGLLPNVPQF